jgi:hypothetical protein
MIKSIKPDYFSTMFLKLKTLFRNYSFILLAIAFFACSKPIEKPKLDTSKGTYFSLYGFVQDQWNTYKGQPFVLNKTVTLNGKTDSSLVAAINVSWGQIFKIFFEADISDPKFLDQYNFSMYEESTTQTRTFSYEAKDPKLYTQKLQIAADLYNDKVRSIYIETQKNTFWNNQSKKLFYSPVHILQIQEHNNPLLGRSKDLVILYRFL